VVTEDFEAELALSLTSRVEMRLDAEEQMITDAHTGDSGGYVSRWQGDNSPVLIKSGWGINALMLPTHLHAAIRKHLAETGKSERALSLEAGLNEKAVSQILAGKSMHPRGDTLQGLANVMGVSVSSLLSGETHQNTSKNMDRLSARNAAQHSGQADPPPLIPNALEEQVELLRALLAAKDAELAALKSGTATTIAGLEEFASRLIDAVYEDAEREGHNVDEKKILKEALETEVSLFSEAFSIPQHHRGRIASRFWRGGRK